MYWVEHYYDKLERTEEIDQRRVFLASDDPTVLQSARQKWVKGLGKIHIELFDLGFTD